MKINKPITPSDLDAVATAVVDAEHGACELPEDENVKGAWPNGLDPFDLSYVTHGERLFLWRRRQRGGAVVGRAGAGLSAAEAATAVGATPAEWTRVETEGHSCRRLVAALGRPEPPTVGELCRVARRRSGLELVAVEADLGVSRPTLHRMERVGYPRLIEYWRGKGYRFPGDSARETEEP